MSRVTCHVSRVTCHVSHVTCHMSRVTCHLSHDMCQMSHFYLFYIYFFFTKWRSLSLEGLLSTGPTLSSLFCINKIISHLLKSISPSVTTPIQNKRRRKEKAGGGKEAERGGQEEKGGGKEEEGGGKDAEVGKRLHNLFVISMQG